jgi:hypothetical protein
MSGKERQYVSYLLRLSQVLSKDRLVWRASLERANTGESRGFACLADPFAFLEQETASTGEDVSASSLAADDDHLGVE